MAAVPVRARYRRRRGRKRPRVCVFRSIISYLSELWRFGKLNNVEGIRLRRREADRPIRRIPEICADVFGSSVRPRLIELCIPKDGLLISGPTHRQHVALASQASKAGRLGVTARA